MRKVDLLAIHNQFFSDFEFKLDESLLIYEKDFPVGKQVVFIHYTEYLDSNILEYNLGVRIDQVEMLIHKFISTLDDYATRSITMIQTLDKIDKELPKRFVIKNDWELSEVIQRMEKFFVTSGFYWMDAMINPLKLERAFMEQKDNSFKTQNFVYNAFRATALSKIYNPVDYPEVRKSFLRQIKENNKAPFTIASYLQFLDHLDHLVPA
jgi:hypothetical protein